MQVNAREEMELLLALASVAKTGGSVERQEQAWERHWGGGCGGKGCLEPVWETTAETQFQVHREVGIELHSDGRCVV